MKGKLRTLVISYELAQGGAELFAYQVARSLNRERFDVEIVTRWRPNDRQLYASRLEQEGFNISRPTWFGMLVGDRLRRFRGTRLRRLAIKFASLFDRGLRRLIRDADLVLISQIENYVAVQEHVAGKAVVLHLMSNRFQYDYDIYADCDPRRRPALVLIDPEQENGIRGSGLEGARRIPVNLSIDFQGRQTLYDPTRRSRNPIRIGVFQRLNRQERPFVPLLQALKELRKSVDAHLHVYGRGDREIFAPEIDQLGLRNYVHFEGHAEDMREPLSSAGLSLTWMTSFAHTLGYASIEIASYGVPIVFWNCAENPPETVRAATGGVYAAYCSVQDLVAETRHLLGSDDWLRAYGERLRHHIMERYDLRTMMAVIEPFYETVAAEERA